MLVRIHTCYNLPEAAVLNALLHQHGIPCSLQGWHHANMNWPLLVALGGVGLAVPRQQAEDANLLITSGQSAPNWKSCESRAFFARPLLNTIIAFAFIWFLGIVCPAWNRSRPMDRNGGAT